MPVMVNKSSEPARKQPGKPARGGSSISPAVMAVAVILLLAVAGAAYYLFTVGPRGDDSASSTTVIAPAPVQDAPGGIAGAGTGMQPSLNPPQAPAGQEGAPALPEGGGTLPEESQGR